MQEKAIFAAGCFWGVEAVLQKIRGVKSTRVGYIGGQSKNPDYKTVCSGATGHAEAVEVLFDPQVISYDELLNAFWQLHDPTQLNRQGPDVGTQYRSAVFHTSEMQRLAAERSKTEVQKQHQKPIVTEIAAAGDFWPAEEYHQCYVQKKHGFGFF